MDIILKQLQQLCNTAKTCDTMVTGHSVTEGTEFRHCTCTCRTCDLNTMGKPIPVLYPRSGQTAGGLQQDSMAICGVHVDSHRIPGGVKYTGLKASLSIDRLVDLSLNSESNSEQRSLGTQRVKYEE
jgi:hypothetical protein